MSERDELWDFFAAVPDNCGDERMVLVGVLRTVDEEIFDGDVDFESLPWGGRPSPSRRRRKMLREAKFGAAAQKTREIDA